MPYTALVRLPFGIGRIVYNSHCINSSASTAVKYLQDAPESDAGIQWGLKGGTSTEGSSSWVHCEPFSLFQYYHLIPQLTVLVVK